MRNDNLARSDGVFHVKRRENEMSQKYKVLCDGGIDLDGRHVDKGKTFDPLDKFNPWCEAMVRNGNLARIDDPEPIKKK